VTPIEQEQALTRLQTEFERKRRQMVTTHRIFSLILFLISAAIILMI
jgi:hypothetical protein